MKIETQHIKTYEMLQKRLKEACKALTPKTKKKRKGGKE